MQSLQQEGRYLRLWQDKRSRIREVFAGYYLNEAETMDTVKETFEKNGYLADTHTAVGIGCARKYIAETGDTTPMVVASTASPYKFAADVAASIGKSIDSDEPAEILASLSEATGTEIPAPLKRTLTLPVRFTRTVDPSDMPEVALGR